MSGSWDAERSGAHAPPFLCRSSVNDYFRFIFTAAAVLLILCMLAAPSAAFDDLTDAAAEPVPSAAPESDSNNPTAAPTPTLTPTASPESDSNNPTAAPTPTSTPTASPESDSNNPTAAPTPTLTPTASPDSDSDNLTAAPTPTSTPTASPESDSDNITAVPTPTLTPTAEPTTAVTPTVSPENNETAAVNGKDAGNNSSAPSGTEPVLVEQTLIKDTADNHRVTVSGLMPVNITLSVIPLEQDLVNEILRVYFNLPEGSAVPESFFAYDITLTDCNGSVFQPEEFGVTVSVGTVPAAAAVPMPETVSVVHVDTANLSVNECAEGSVKIDDVDLSALNETVMSAVEDAAVSEDSVEFTAKSFSWYIGTGTTTQGDVSTLKFQDETRYTFTYAENTTSLSGKTIGFSEAESFSFKVIPDDTHYSITNVTATPFTGGTESILHKKDGCYTITSDGSTSYVISVTAEEAVLVTTEAELRTAVDDGGNIKLGADISLTSQLDISKNVVLDLNGYILGRASTYNGRAIAVFANLTFIDSGYTLHRFNNTSKIWKLDGDGAYQYCGGVVYDYTTGGVNTMINVTGINGNIIINDGLFTGASVTSRGSLIYVHDSGTLTVNGGEIKGNYAESSAGAILVKGGTFVMTGGTISNNTAGANGGAICTDGTCSFTMTGGYIWYNNAATNTDVAISDTTTFTNSGGQIGTDKKVGVVLPTILPKLYTGYTLTAYIPSQTHYTVVENTGGTAPGRYPVILKLTDNSTYMWADGDEHDLDPITVWFTITPQKGDVNCDGPINIVDSACIGIYLLNGGEFLNETQKTVANVSASPGVTIDDLQLINQYLVGSITTFSGVVP